MHVVATAGHVDHGKSTLVRALTGADPDRWAEEHRRGLTIDLGFAWTGLPSGEEIAIVDVPGHERFVSNMLAGTGPVPAALLVVAADAGWMPQSAEHLAALDAFDVRHGILVVSRSDVAAPGPATDEARERLAGTSLADIPAVAVSAVTGDGIDTLVAELDTLVAGLPVPAPDAPVRLWVDRSFVIRGAGTVVTGTLPAGTIHAEDELRVSRTGKVARVRSLQTLGRDVHSAGAVSRVALNLRGVDHGEIKRGDALLGGVPWALTSTVDVRIRSALDAFATHAMLHVGSAAVPVRVRQLGDHTLRLRLRAPLPLVAGDRGLLRDPGQHLVVGGFTVLDADPPPLRRRGAARARGAELESMDERGRSTAELSRRRFMRHEDFQRLGLVPASRPVSGDWHVDQDTWDELPRALTETVREWERARPLEAGMPIDAVRRRLGVPARSLVEDAATRANLRIESGRVTARPRGSLPASVESALLSLEKRWAAEPFVAPEAGELQELGLGPKEIAAAARAGRLLRLADGVVLAPDADARAIRALAGLPTPTFTLSEARRTLGTTRRVAVPLMELLDRQGKTERVSSDARRLVGDD